MTEHDAMIASPENFRESRTPVARKDGLLLFGLLLMGFVLFGVRMGDLTIRGEESRRALVAVEILRSGDWIVPRIQNELYFSRPPLQNWLIAVGGLWRGTIDEWSIRWYSGLSTILTSVVLFLYCREFMSRAAAFLAGLAFLTSFQVLELGLLGETEALFTFLLSSSLLLWHLGEMRGWPPVVRWCLGYGLAAAATLTKGPQAPVYFCGSVAVYSVWKRDWKLLMHWSHLVGILLYSGLVGCWMLPYAARAGWEAVPRVFMDTVGQRFERQTFSDLIQHMVTYPFEIVACMMPWSLFLVSCFQKSFRSTLRKVWPILRFSLVVIALAFPSVWLVPGARARYFLPLYPFFMPLVAFSIEGCWRSLPVWHWQFGWRRLMNTMTCLAGVLTVIGLWGMLVPSTMESIIQYSRLQWTVFGLVASVLAVRLAMSRTKQDEASILGGSLAAAAVLALIWTAGWTEIVVQRSLRIRDRVEQLATEFSDDARFVSLDDVDHKFALYFGRPIERIDHDQFEDLIDTLHGSELANTYFCFKENKDVSFEPDVIALTRVAEISTDRHRGSREAKKVVLARLSDTVIAERSGRTLANHRNSRSVLGN